MTATTITMWDLRGKDIADLGALTIKGTGRTEGDDAYKYINNALMSTIDIILDLIVLKTNNHYSKIGRIDERMLHSDATYEEQYGMCKSTAA